MKGVFKKIRGEYSGLTVLKISEMKALGFYINNDLIRCKSTQGVL